MISLQISKCRLTAPVNGPRRKNEIRPPRENLSRPKGGGLRHITSFFQPVENKLRLSCNSTKAETDVNLPDPKWGEEGGGGHSSCIETTGKCEQKELAFRKNENLKPIREKVKGGEVINTS